jgi:hypothetical protein
VEKRREEFEFQITSNIKSSLKKILSDIWWKIYTITFFGRELFYSHLFQVF